jgi:hypothetical protein
MKQIFTIIFISLFSILGSTSILAQDTEKQDQKEKQTEKSEKKETIEQAPPGNVKTAETFTPSEEVSEDLSVSFPVDI